MRAAWAMVMAAVGLSACAAPSAPVAASGEMPALEVTAASQLVVAEDERVNAPWRKELYRTEWRNLDATLLGVDEVSGRAYIKLRSRKPARYVIDTVDITTGERIERWEASATRAAGLADYDARFMPLGSTPALDLERLGGMMRGWTSRAHREGSAWPVADAAPGGDAVIYMQAPKWGQGDWLYLHQAGKARDTRIARGTVASYDAKFSPDGEQIAWRGCVGRRPCRYFLYLTSVKQAAAGMRPKRIAAVQSPRGPVWGPKGDAVRTLGTHRDGRRCIMRTTVPTRKPWRRATTTVEVCDDKLTSFVQSPDGEHVLYAKRDGHDAELGYLVAGAETPEVVVQLQDTTDVTVSDAGLALVDHDSGVLAIDLKDSRRRLHDGGDGSFVFVPNVHWLSGDTALMLEKSFADGSVRLVRADVNRFLGR